MASMQAQAIGKYCFGCSAAEMNQLAWESVTEMASQGPLYALDLRNGVVRKYEYRNNVTGSWNPEFDPFEQWAEEVPVESNVAAGVADVGNYMRAASHESIILPPNTPGMPSDVYEAITTSSYDDDIAYWINLNSTGDFYNRAADALQLISTWFGSEGLRVYVKFQWQDGSSAMYGWDSVQKTWVRIPNTARDGRKNLIPESKEQLSSKTYLFPNATVGGSDAADDFYDMWNYIKGMEVPVIDGTGGLGGYGYKMVCTPDRCDIYIQPR